MRAVVVLWVLLFARIVEIGQSVSVETQNALSLSLSLLYTTTYVSPPFQFCCKKKHLYKNPKHFSPVDSQNPSGPDLLLSFIRRLLQKTPLVHHLLSKKTPPPKRRERLENRRLRWMRRTSPRVWTRRCLRTRERARKVRDFYSKTFKITRRDWNLYSRSLRG